MGKSTKPPTLIKIVEALANTLMIQSRIQYVGFPATRVCIITYPKGSISSWKLTELIAKIELLVAREWPESGLKVNLLPLSTNYLIVIG